MSLHHSAKLAENPHAYPPKESWKFLKFLPDVGDYVPNVSCNGNKSDLTGHTKLLQYRVEALEPNPIRRVATIRVTD